MAALRSTICVIPPYRLFDHTADLGVKVTGETLKALFENAAVSLGDLIAEGTSEASAVTERWTISGMDLPDLMVNWLREILYRWTGEGRLIDQAVIHDINENALIAEVVFSPFDPSIHGIRHEIKAVTYHQVSVVESQGMWTATAVLDL